MGTDSTNESFKFHNATITILLFPSSHISLRCPAPILKTMSHIRLVSCTTLIQNGTFTNSTVLHVKGMLAIPSITILVGTMVLSMIILVALVLSQCYNSSNDIFYFNVSLTDMVMAFVCIVLFVPDDSISWFEALTVVSVVQILRQVWSLTFLFLMINRYNLVQGKPGLTTTTTYVAIAIAWCVGIVQATYWSLRVHGGRLNYLSSTVVGVVFDNVMLLNQVVPLPIVVTLLVLTLRRAKIHLARIADAEDIAAQTAARQVGSGLKLLYAFGLLYILGFGFEFVVAVNSLINLSGYLNVVPLWEKDPTFCQYLFGVDELVNMIINFTNSLIIVQSHHVQTALKKMYQATSNMIKNVTNVRYEGDVRNVRNGDGEKLLKDGQSTSTG